MSGFKKAIFSLAKILHACYKLVIHVFQILMTAEAAIDVPGAPVQYVDDIFGRLNQYNGDQIMGPGAPQCRQSHWPESLLERYCGEFAQCHSETFSSHI